MLRSVQRQGELIDPIIRLTDRRGQEEIKIDCEQPTDHGNTAAMRHGRSATATPRLIPFSQPLRPTTPKPIAAPTSMMWAVRFSTGSRRAANTAAVTLQLAIARRLPANAKKTAWNHAKRLQVAGVRRGCTCQFRPNGTAVPIPSLHQLRPRQEMLKDAPPKRLGSGWGFEALKERRTSIVFQTHL